MAIQQWSANSADCSVSPFSIALGKLDTFPLFFLFVSFVSRLAKQWFVQYLTTDFHCKFPALEKATRRNGGTKRS